MLMSYRCSFLAAVAVTFLLSPSANAHQEWLMPNVFVTDGGDDDGVWLSFEHALGDDRFVAALGPGPALLSVLGPNDETASPTSVFTGKTRTIAEVELEKPGTYRFTAVGPKSYWTKLKEGGKTRWVPLSRDRVNGKKKIEVSKRYWSQSVAYVTFRKKTQGALASQGDPIELLPVDHPNAVVAKKRFRVRVLANGAPLPSATIKVYGATEGHEPAFQATSGADGRAGLRFPAPGHYLVSVTHEVPAPKDPKADAYSYSSYVMLEVVAKGAKKTK